MHQCGSASLNSLILGYKNHLRMTLKRYFLLTLLLISLGPAAICQDDLNVINGKWLIHSNAGNSLYDHFTNESFRLLNERSAEVLKLSTPEQWMSRQGYIKEKLAECIGSFPEKTPLNARITGTIIKDEFRVEHVVFESIPGFYVTSSLYIPAGTRRNQKLPAIVYCSGHSADGYRSAPYQHLILNLVKKGFIVFAFDPVGQGERLEYFDKAKGKSDIGGPTSEHSYPGAQAFISGNSQAKFMIWDGIRAVDYLLTRREVDPARIGITGRSGGGTQSAYIAAFDDRILAAAPENYITNYTRLLQTIGPQDAEQNLPGFISKGLDHADFLIVRAPKPALMITTTNDMFSIQGAMETEKEVFAAYMALGNPGNFSRCEDDAGHASTLKNREALYAFFNKHLGNPGNAGDENTEPLTREELRVTESGQVSVSLRGETVYSLSLNDAVRLEQKPDDARSSAQGYSRAAVEWAKILSGYVAPVTIPDPVFTGRIARDGYSIEKFFVRGSGKYIIPYLVFRPENPIGRGLIYLHPRGKAAGADGDIQKIVSKGWTVLAPDLPGTGETASSLRGDANFGGASHNLWYAGILTGNTITGLRASDLTLLAGILKKNGFIEISGIALSDMAPVLLHSAAISGAFTGVVLLEPYSSYMSLVAERRYNPFFALSAVPGSAGRYDLPDLAASLAPGKLVIAGTVDGSGKRNNIDRIQNDIGIVKSEYTRKGAGDNLVILDSIPEDIQGLFNYF